MPLARADLESLLRTRRLDRTLTTALPPEMFDESACAPTGHTALDARLGGGFPRGQLSEIVGPRSSGRTSLLVHLLAAATARGELVALVDALDTLDVASAEAAGVQLDRLLWVRGHVVSHPGLCRDMNQRALEQAVRAFTLVLQAGNFGVVAFDVADAPAEAVRRLPFTTWMRLQRLVEGSPTAGVLVGAESMARSSAGLTVKLGIRDSGSACGQREAPEGSARSAPPSASEREPSARSAGGGAPAQQRMSGPASLGKSIRGIRFGSRLFEGLESEVRVIRARARLQEDTSVAVRTLAASGA